MNVQEELAEIEKELVDEIIQHLQANKIDLSEAQKLARDFLSVVSQVRDQQDLLKKLRDLGQVYKEVGDVYVKELDKTSMLERDKILTQVRSYITQGRMDEAIEAGKLLD